MGIALLGCSMLVACGNDEEENTTPSVKVTFGGTEWEPTVTQIYTANFENFGVNEYLIYKTAEALPFMDMVISGQPGDFEHSATQGTNSQGGYTYYAWQTGQSTAEMYLPLYSIDYFESQMVQVAERTYKGDWQPVSAKLKVTAYDPNTLTATFNLTATMYDFYSWNADLVTNVEDAETKSLEVKVNNFVFTQITSK